MKRPDARARSSARREADTLRAGKLEAQRRERIARYEREYRFRPYIIRGGKHVWLAGAGTQEEAGIVPMLLTLADDGEFERTEPVGILDTDPWAKGYPGSWVINPFPRHPEM